MPISISSLPPATDPVPVDFDQEDAEPYTRSIEFSELWADKKQFSFFDLLDVINPLQHIPLISSIYRKLSGDEIGLAARIIGGALFGGPFGLFNAALTAAVEETTGKEPGGHLLAVMQEIIGPGEKPVRAPAPQSAELPDENKPSSATEPLAETAPMKADPAQKAPAAAAISSPPSIARRSVHFNRPAPFAPAPMKYGTPAAQHLPVGARRTPAAGEAVHAEAAFSHPAAERARIAQKIFAAQKAQASILLASIATNLPLKPDASRGGKPEHNEDQQANPFLRHPNAIPPGASPQWVSSAMGRALDKYQQTYRLRGTGMALPLPKR